MVIGQGGTFMVAGKLEAGAIQNGEKVMLMPAGEQGLIKGKKNHSGFLQL